MAIKGLFSYSQQSEGARDLAALLKVPRIKHRKSTFVGNKTKTVINWGATEVPDYVSACVVLNSPNTVRMAVDKAVTLRLFREAGVSCPEFSGSLADAQRWLNEGHAVFARQLTRASSGRGIVIMYPDHPDTWETRAPLYTKYVKKRYEYRVHVVRDEVIDVQRKGLRQELEGREDINHMIRNLANGFVFVRNDGREIPECVKKVGLEAVRALGLDFGAVDILYNERQNAAYAIEVNCAPGLQGTTITSYADAFKKI